MPPYLPVIRPGLLAWLDSVRCQDAGWGRWRYHAAMTRPWALQASAIAINVLQELGELDRIPAAQRREAVDFFLSCQDEADGLFKDPLETEETRIDYHTWPQIWGQRHGATMEALKHLHATPRYPLPEAQFVDLARMNVADWVASLDWRNPWMRGEDWWRAIEAYLRHHPADGRAAPLAAMFDALESTVLDPATGFPTRGGCEDPGVAMCGLFKILFGYAALGRPYPHAAAAIDATLALQHPNGEFGRPRNMCMNWDALLVLRQLDRQLDGACRHGDILDAGRRTCEVLLSDYRQADGGFAFQGELCLKTHHSIRLCEEPQPIGDMLGAIMCLRCFAYVDDWTERP